MMICKMLGQKWDLFEIPTRNAIPQDGSSYLLLQIRAESFATRCACPRVVWRRIQELRLSDTGTIPLNANGCSRFVSLNLTD